MSTMKTVTQFLAKHDLFSVSPREDVNDAPEYYFSRSGCDCCNASDAEYGGLANMVIMSSGARNSDGAVLEFEICNDCLAYAANGDDQDGK